jgi:hypothetical protein
MPEYRPPSNEVGYILVYIIQQSKVAISSPLACALLRVPLLITLSLAITITHSPYSSNTNTLAHIPSTNILIPPSRLPTHLPNPRPDAIPREPTRAQPSPLISTSPARPSRVQPSPAQRPRPHLARPAVIPAQIESCFAHPPVPLVSHGHRHRHPTLAHTHPLPRGKKHFTPPIPSTNHHHHHHHPLHTHGVGADNPYHTISIYPTTHGVIQRSAAQQITAAGSRHGACAAGGMYARFDLSWGAGWVG